MWSLYFLVIGISLIILALVVKLSKIDFKYLKENYKAILSYFFILIITFFLILYVAKLGYNKTEIFINTFILFMLSCAVSIIFVSPIIALLQKHEEKRIVNEYEKQYKIDNFIFYRDLIGNISPGILFALYNKNNNIEDLVVALYLYMLQKKIIKVKDNRIERNDTNLNYLHENLLIKYLTGNITKEKMQKSIFNFLKQDIKKHNFIYDTNKKIDFTESMQLIIIWLIITLIIMIPTFLAISFNGLYLVLAYVLAFVAIPIYQQVIKAIHPFFKTNESLQIIAKLNGLKRFYKEFNVINNKSIEEIKLYEDYIIYGIIFNDKGNLNKEVHILYKSITDYAENYTKNQLKEFPKNKLIDLEKHQWISIIILLTISLIIILAVNMDNRFKESSFALITCLFPVLIIILSLLASHQNKCKKKANNEEK